jgi:hypothetical protein
LSASYGDDGSDQAAKKARDEKVFDFATFLANSARGSLEEGVFSASLRLVDALSRLAALFPDEVSNDQFLREITDYARTGMTRNFLGSRESYVNFLDEMIRKFAREIKRRNGL